MDRNANGNYDPRMDEITLNQELRSDPEKLKDTLVHEVQHAIQEREHFTSGASKNYWNRRMEEGFDARTAAEKREGTRLQAEYDQMRQADPQFVKDMEALNEMTPTVPRGKFDFDTLEQVEPDPPEWEAFDRRRDELEEKYGDKVWDYFQLRDSIEANRRRPTRMPGALYYNTAGEVEARDVTARRTMNAQERRAMAPNLGNEDTVFARNGQRASSEDYEPMSSAEYAQMQRGRAPAGPSEREAAGDASQPHDGAGL